MKKKIQPSQAQALPFAINRSQAVPLTEQIARGIQGAIWGGTLQAGSRLPGIREIAAQLDVSDLVVRHAITRLAKEGVLVARPRTGISVLAADKHHWQHHVLFLTRGNSVYSLERDEAYFCACFENHIRLTTMPLIEAELEQGLPSIRAILDTQTVDLVVIQGLSAGIISELANRKAHFVHFCAQDASRLAWGKVEFENRAAYTGLANHFLACGAKEINVIYARPSAASALEDALGGAGLKIKAIIPSEPYQTGLDKHERTGYSATKALLKRNPSPFIYYADEYLGRGGIVALLEAGIDVPGTMQFASHSNRGFRPTFSKPVTCIEADPVEHGRVMADLTLQALTAKRAIKQPVYMRMRFIAGETTKLR